MPFFARPTPSGVTGTVDITGSPQFGITLYRWSRGVNIPTRVRAGRGQPRWEAFRKLNIGSTISLSGEAFSGMFPLPIGMQNSSANITIVFSQNNNSSVNLVGDVIEYSESMDAKKKEDNWLVGLSIKLTQEPVYSSFGNTQQTPAVQTFADQQTDAGLSKTIDNNLLRTAANVQWDVGTIVDSDAAEVAKATSFLASATPVQYLKPITATLARTDRGGVVVDAQFGLVDSKDAILNPETTVKFDPYYIEGEYVSGSIIHTSALINSSALTFTAPDANYAVDFIRTEKLNDYRNNRTTIITNSDSQLRQTMPRSPHYYDQFNLTNHAASAITRSGALSAITATFINRGVEMQQVAKNRVVSTNLFGARSTKDDVTMPRSQAVIDASFIDTSFNSATLHSSGNFRLTMLSTIAALSSVGNSFEQLTPTRWVSVDHLRPQNTAQAIQNRGSVSRRSSVEAFTDTSCIVIPCLATDTIQNISDAYYAANQSVANLLTITAEKINPLRARVIAFYFTPGVMVYGSTRSVTRYVPARYNSGTPQVFVSGQPINLDGSQYQYFLQDQMLTTAVRQFMICETLSGTSVPDQYATAGLVNSDTFIGISPGNCIYDGAQYQVKLISGTRIFRMFYLFREDLNGFMTYKGTRNGWTPPTTDVLTTGWNNAANLTHNEANITLPSTANFTSLFGTSGW